MGSACYRYRSGGIRGRESRFPDRGRKLYRYTVVRTRLFCRESRFPDRGRKSCTVFVSELCDVVEKVDSPIGDENESHKYSPLFLKCRESRFPDRGRKFLYNSIPNSSFNKCRESRFPDRGRKQFNKIFHELKFIR